MAATGTPDGREIAATVITAAVVALVAWVIHVRTLPPPPPNIPIPTPPPLPAGPVQSSPPAAPGR